LHIQVWVYFTASLLYMLAHLSMTALITYNSGLHLNVTNQHQYKKLTLTLVKPTILASWLLSGPFDNHPFLTMVIWRDRKALSYTYSLHSLYIWLICTLWLTKPHKCQDICLINKHGTLMPIINVHHSSPSSLSTNFIAMQVLKQNFRAAMCHVLHYRCNVNGAVDDSLHCRMICGTVPFSVHT